MKKTVFSLFSVLSLSVQSQVGFAGPMQDETPPADATSPISKLPAELINLIARELTIGDAAKFARVDKFVYGAVQDDLAKVKNTMQIGKISELKQEIDQSLSGTIAEKLFGLGRLESGPRVKAADLYFDVLRFDAIEKLYGEEINRIHIHQGSDFEKNGNQGKNSELREKFANILWVLFEFEDGSKARVKLLLKPSKLEKLYNETQIEPGEDLEIVCAWDPLRNRTKTRKEPSYYAVVQNQREFFQILSSKGIYALNYSIGKREVEFFDRKEAEWLPPLEPVISERILKEVLADSPGGASQPDEVTRSTPSHSP